MIRITASGNCPNGLSCQGNLELFCRRVDDMVLLSCVKKLLGTRCSVKELQPQMPCHGCWTWEAWTCRRRRVLCLRCEPRIVHTKPQFTVTVDGGSVPAK
jgi:hypothetical protein